MKKALFIIAATIASLAVSTNAKAQQLFFWTDETEALPIRIYVDKEFVGELTQGYSEDAVVGLPGTLLVNVSDQKHTLTAVNSYGEIYDRWPGKIRPRTCVNEIKLYSKGFVAVATASIATYDWLYFGWDPEPRPFHRPAPEPSSGSLKDRLNPEDNDELVITMAVAAFGGIASMAYAAAKNWKFPDARFPYSAIGYKFQYLCGLDAMRNTISLKKRIGNLGGMSLIADAGFITSYLPYWETQSAPKMNFTWSAGFGFDYAGFSFGLRYKPAFSEKTETFAVADLTYDIMIGKHLMLTPGIGFGLSGYGRRGDIYSFTSDWGVENVRGGLLQHFEYPVSIGLSYRF